MSFVCEWSDFIIYRIPNIKLLTCESFESIEMKNETEITEENDRIYKIKIKSWVKHNPFPLWNVAN